MTGLLPIRPTPTCDRWIHVELFVELAARGFQVRPGQLGENITTTGVDLLALSWGTQLHGGEAPVVEVTGLRNPGAQIDAFAPGLLGAVAGRDGTDSWSARPGS